MRGLLFVLCIATIGADRIDLLAGGGPIVLKPFLILAPLIVLLEGAAVMRRGRGIKVSQDDRWFLIAQTALFCVLLVSVAWSFDMRLALGRLTLITVEGYLCFLVVLLLVNRGDRRDILVRAAVAGITMMLVMDGLQIGRWLDGSWGEWLELGGIVDITPAMYGPLIPRPSGLALDANRGGFLILMYIFMLWLLAPRTRSRAMLLTAAWLALLITLSRSTVLAAIVTSAGWLVWRGVRMPRATIGRIAAAGIAIVVTLLLSGAARELALATGEMLAGRVSLEEGSSSDHISLIARGWEVATGDVRTFLLGIGFGNSYLVLQDFFGGTKYANFHSMYITMLVEAGIIALLPMMVLMGYPFARASAVRPIVLGLVFFNIFYQAHAEAFFWFVLALAWMLPDVRDMTDASRVAHHFRGNDPTTREAAHGRTVKDQLLAAPKGGR